MKKGQIVNPVGYAKYLAEFIESTNGEFFTAGEATDAVASLVSDMPRNYVVRVVTTELLAWTRDEFLLRGVGDNGKFIYLGFAKPIRDRLTKGEVVEAVWRVLYSATAPMKFPDIYSTIDPSAGRLFRDEVGYVLRCWTTSRVLHRDGQSRQYTYRLTGEARARGTRPPCAYDKKSHPVASNGNMAHAT